MDMAMGAQFSAVTELVACLEKATLMSKQLPNTTDPSKITEIHAALHAAHFHLSFCLAQSFQPPPPQPSLNHDEPMQVVDEEEEEEEEGEFRPPVDRVEERMRDVFIQNKRLKRPLSPAAAAEAEPPRQPRESVGFDPLGTRSRALDLIYQFHG